MDDEDVISLHALFTNNNYVKTKFSLSYHSPNSTEGNNNADNVNNASVELWCSHSASTDYDLTGQIVWPVSRELFFVLMELIMS